MALSGDSFRYAKWYIILGSLFIFGIVLVVLCTDLFDTAQPGKMPDFVWLVCLALIIAALAVVITKLVSLQNRIENNGQKLEKIADAYEKNKAVLGMIMGSSQLSEGAKTVAYRTSEIRAIRQAVFDKLQTKDFEAATKLIDELEDIKRYRDLADQLRKETTEFRSGGDESREGQLIANIDKLLDEYQWGKAAQQIENLIKAFPGSKNAQQMPQKLLDKKQDRKKTLLSLWDDAVKRRATDRSLEILRELDQYLSPNEGLALQEAARDSFRTKLHNLGVQFSLAVSGKQWQKAIETGQLIVRDFPNSRMAQEIRENMEALKQKAGA